MVDGLVGIGMEDTGLGVHRCATCLLCDVWVDGWFDMIKGMGGKDRY